MKTMVFIDGANLYNAVKNLQFEIDFIRLKRWLIDEFNLLRINYYSLYDNDHDYNSIHKLLDWLQFNGYTVKKSDYSVSCEMIADMCLMSQKGIEHVVLISGNGDFCYAIEKIKECGCGVTVINSKATIARCLSQLADNYVDLDKIKSRIEKADVP